MPTASRVEIEITFGLGTTKSIQAFPAGDRTRNPPDDLIREFLCKSLRAIENGDSSIDYVAGGGIIQLDPNYNLPETGCPPVLAASSRAVRPASASRTLAANIKPVPQKPAKKTAAKKPRKAAGAKPTKRKR